MVKLRNAVSTLLTISLVTLYTYYFSSPDKNTKLTDAHLIYTPDLTLQNFKLLEFNEKGQLAKEVVSNYVTHIPNQNQYFLNAPKIHFRGSEDTFYDLISNQAKTFKGFDQMIFDGHVVLNQPPSANTQAFSMVTESLTYLPKQEQAFTHKPVEFNQTGHVVHANGMQADLKTNHIKLHRAKAELQPTHA